MKNLLKKLCLSTILTFAFLAITNFNKSTFAMESNTSKSTTFKNIKLYFEAIDLKRKLASLKLNLDDFKLQFNLNKPKIICKANFKHEFLNKINLSTAYKEYDKNITKLYQHIDNIIKLISYLLENLINSENELTYEKIYFLKNELKELGHIPFDKFAEEITPFSYLETNIPNLLNLQ